MTRLPHATPAALLAASVLVGGCTVGPDRKTPPSPVKTDSFASLAGADVDGAAPELKPVATAPIAATSDRFTMRAFQPSASSRAEDSE